MHSILISKVNLTKLCTVLLLLTVLAGCGGSASGLSPSSGKTSLTPTVNAHQETVLLPNAGGSFDTSGLLHVETDGVTCPVDHFTPFRNTLVLSKDRLTYDSGEIQQMVVYADGVLNAQSPPPPDTMQIVLGSTYGEFRDWNILNGTGCTMGMEITNIGKTSFQISQMALRLTADPQQNSYRYRLIDICSLPLPAQALPTCPPISGGGGMATIFEFKLKMGSAGTVFQGQYSRDSSSQSPTLDPGQAAGVELFISPSDPSSNLIYSVVPQLTLDLSGEERAIQLTQLPSKIVFVTPSQLSCYGLQGTTFSLLSPGPHNKSWCL